MKGQRTWGLLALGAAASIAVTQVVAQSPSTSAGGAASAGSSAATTAAAGGSSATAAPAPNAAAASGAAPAGSSASAVPAKPLPSDLESLAPHALVLSVKPAGSQLVAVGDYGDIMLSTDGAKWRQVRAPARAALTAVYFSDSQNGWAVGHDAAIEHTSDGGHTWVLQSFRPELQEPLLDVLFVDGQRGFAVGAYGLFEQTKDGGSSWTEVTAPNIRGDQLHMNTVVRLADGQLLIAGEQGLVASSGDQGTTWARLKLPYDGSIFGALPFGPHGALLFGLRGHVFVNDDIHAGTWRPVDTGTSNSFFGGTRLKDGSYILVGAEGTELKISADGTGVQKLPGVGGTALSGVTAWNGALILIGEAGIQQQGTTH